MTVAFPEFPFIEPAYDRTRIMAFPVGEFSREGYKIRKVFG